MSSRRYTEQEIDVARRVGVRLKTDEERDTPAIDDFREDAARCCEETAKQERGERYAVRLDPNDLVNNEFSWQAAEIASEVAGEVGQACVAARIGFHPALCWDLAAKLLRSGWQRGHRLQPMVTRGAPS